METVVFMVLGMLAGLGLREIAKREFRARIKNIEADRDFWRKSYLAAQEANARLDYVVRVQQGALQRIRFGKGSPMGNN